MRRVVCVICYVLCHVEEVETHHSRANVNFYAKVRFTASGSSLIKLIFTCLQARVTPFAWQILFVAYCRIEFSQA